MKEQTGDDSAVVSDLAALLRHLNLADLQALEDFCEDEMELLAVVWTDEFDVGETTLLINAIGSPAAIGLTFPFTMSFFHETLTDIEEQVIGFA